MITTYLIRNPQIVWMLLLAIVVAGLSCLSVMPRIEDPILKRRVGVVSTTWVGASSTEVESTVTIPMEKWLQSFPELKQIRSNTRANVTNIVLELADDVYDPDPIWSAIDRKLTANAGKLPAGCNVPELTVFPLKAFAAIVAIVPTENRTTLHQASLLAQEMQTRLLNVPGTEVVDLFGTTEQELLINVKPETLAATGLTTTLIAKQVAENQIAPGGNINTNDSRLPVEVPVATDLKQRVQSLFIKLPGREQSLRLNELAEVTRQPTSPTEEQAIVDGKDAVVLGVLVDDKTRIDHWTRKLNSELAKFKNGYPGEFEIRSLFLQNDEVQQRLTGLLQNLMLSTLAVVAIVFLFMGWRCMLVVALSLPLSACLVICGMHAMSIPIHQISVTGLIVSLGLLIDNAIVMVEDVRAKIYNGNTPLGAIHQSVRHLRFPLLGSTLTTILAFLPIAILPGPSGEFVGSLAVSVILAVSASLALALTVIPTLVSFVGVQQAHLSFLDFGMRNEWMTKIYGSTLVTLFRFPIVGVGLGAIAPAIGFFVASELPRQFFPATDRAQIQIEIELAPASSIEAVRKTVDRISSIVESNPNVENQNWFLGKSAPTFYYNVVPRRRDSPNYAQALVDLTGDFEIDEWVNQLQSRIDEAVFEARVNVRKLEQGPPFDAPVEIRLLGEDLRILHRLGDQVRRLLATQPFVTHTQSALGNTALKLHVDLDKDSARRLNTTPQEVAKMLYASVEGAEAGIFFDFGKPTPVRVKVDFRNRSITNTLLATMVTKPPPAGPSAPASSLNTPREQGPLKYPLGVLGEFELNADTGAIVRLNGKRMNEVKAYLKAGVLPSEALQQLKTDLATIQFQLPDQFEIKFGGEDEKRSQAVSNLIANAVVIIAMLILSLVALMGSIRSSLIVIAVGGLAIGLGPLALYCFGFPFGFMAIVGTMGLVGVAINDSIVVLAAIREQQYPAESQTACENESSPQETLTGSAIDMTREEQMAEVVMGCTRHILATTFTTMIGFLPLVIDGGKFWPPLAIVISMGVGGATLLALYFVPSLYLLTHRAKNQDDNIATAPQSV